MGCTTLGFKDHPGATASRAIWPRMVWPLELLVAVAGDLCYEVVQAAAPSNPSGALGHARAIRSLEPRPVVEAEGLLNHALNGHAMLASLAGYYYVGLHLTITGAVLAWLWLRRPGLYARARTVLFSVSLGALAVFWILPVAPPRLAVPGMVDTLLSRHVLGAAAPGSAHGLVNEYAAFPSLHMAWAAWCAWALSGALSGRSRRLVWLYPALTSVVVVATGNHYVLDVLAGLAGLWVAVLAVDGQGRRKVTSRSTPATTTLVRAGTVRATTFPARRTRNRGATSRNASSGLGASNTTRSAGPSTRMP